METQVFKDGKCIVKAYKPNVCLVSFYADFGYDLSENVKKRIIKKIEDSKSFDDFVSKIDGTVCERLCIKLNFKVIGQSINGYTSWVAKRR